MDNAETRREFIYEGALTKSDHTSLGQTVTLNFQL
jgi:hypothetical protein